MHKLFEALGWIMIVGGVVVGVLAYLFIDSQEFVLSLLARLVERPFEYRTYLALLTGVSMVTIGLLSGALYLGIARILQRVR